jgi:nucleotide-binding universal stress UspA family protein
MVKPSPSHQTSRKNDMTILVAYVPRPEGQAALNKGIELAKSQNESLLVVNTSTGGSKENTSFADVQDYERVEAILASSGIDAELKQFVRGKTAVEEIDELVQTMRISMLVIGLRKRSAVGKLIMGSVAQELLLTVSCPVLAVKA